MIKAKPAVTMLSLALLIGVGLSGCDTGTMRNGSDITMEKAPDFTLEKLGGGKVSLSDYRGKILIIDFWATWCPPCRMEMPEFVELYRDYADKGVEIIGISIDQNPQAVLPAFVEKYKINFPILLTDRKVDRAYGGISGIPTTFVVDREGKVYKQYVGMRPREVFEEAIKALLAQN